MNRPSNISIFPNVARRVGATQAAQVLLDKVLLGNSLLFSEYAQPAEREGWYVSTKIDVGELANGLRMQMLATELGLIDRRTCLAILKDQENRYFPKTNVASALGHFTEKGHLAQGFDHPEKPEEKLILIGNVHSNDQNCDQGFSLCGVVAFRGHDLENERSPYFSTEKAKEKIQSLSTRISEQKFKWQQSPSSSVSEANGFAGSAGRDADQFFFQTGMFDPKLLPELNLSKISSVSACVHYQRFI